MDFLVRIVRSLVRSALFLVFVITSLAQAGPINIEVVNAVDSEEIILDAEVILRRNGEQSVTGLPASRGRYTLNPSFADEAKSLLTIKKSGFADLVVECPCNDMTYAMSPIMKSADSLRIVLVWGGKPNNLDANMIVPGGIINHANTKSSQGSLDASSQNGDGPETITLHTIFEGQPYVYGVYDASIIEKFLSSDLSNSKAKVFVYRGSELLQTYNVPINTRGNLWTVFRIDSDGTFQSINKINEVSASSVHKKLMPFLAEDWRTYPDELNRLAQVEAKQLNERGEAAFHAGNVQQAIDFYHRAIDLDYLYGQAYSNLGLANQKVGNLRGSIWASNRAIALANGSSASTMRASSYYNIAKAYEAASMHSDALRNYQLAKDQKNNPAYDRAIQRLRLRIGSKGDVGIESGEDDEFEFSE